MDLLVRVNGHVRDLIRGHKAVKNIYEAPVDMNDARLIGGRRKPLLIPKVSRGWPPPPLPKGLIFSYSSPLRIFSF